MTYEIKRVPKEEVISFVQQHHYSPVMPKLTKHWLGVFKSGSMVGVVTLGWGTRPQCTIQKVVSEECTSRDYFEIGKMCMLDSEPRNSESQMLSRLIKWMKVNCPDVNFLYTLADGIMGKCGYVYQAANFFYGGEFWTDSFISEKGEKVHPRSSGSIYKDNWEWHYNRKSPGFKKGFQADVHRKLVNRIADVDWSKVSAGNLPKQKIKKPQKKVHWPTHEYFEKIKFRWIKGKMFRYIFPLNKKASRMLRDCSKTDWKRGTGAYPKAHNLEWKEKVAPRTFKTLDQMPSWNLSVVDYNRKNVNRVVQFKEKLAS
jgi:hypothetical protein